MLDHPDYLCPPLPFSPRPQQNFSAERILIRPLLLDESLVDNSERKFLLIVNRSEITSRKHADFHGAKIIGQHRMKRSRQRYFGRLGQGI